MYIKEISIKNIRSISEFKMTFPTQPGWHVIIGDNGSGKSSIVRAVAAALIGPDEIGAILPIWEEWLREGQSEASITLEITPDWKYDTIGREQPTTESIKNKFKIIKNKNNGLVFSHNAHEKKLNPCNYNWGDNTGWFSAAYGPFRRFTGGDERRNKVHSAYPKAGAHLSVFGEEYALTEALDWLKELDTKRLKEKEKQSKNSQFNSVSESVTPYKSESEILFNNIKNFINQSGLLPHGALFDSVDIDGDVVFKDGSGKDVKVTQMSDGYRSILSLMFELIRQLVNTYKTEKVFPTNNNPDSEIFINVPGVVLIDEIDAHLHPTWQTRIGEWFTKYFPNLQFIVTTHSPLVCRACEKGSIWRLAAPGSEGQSGEIVGIEKDRLIHGNILDAYGTELFGRSPVRSEKSQEELKFLGILNHKAAFGKITDSEEKERLRLSKIYQTDVTIN